MVATWIVSQTFLRLHAQTIIGFDRTVQDVTQHCTPKLVLLFGLLSGSVILVCSTAYELPRQFPRVGFDNDSLRIAWLKHRDRYA